MGHPDLLKVSLAHRLHARILNTQMSPPAAPTQAEVRTPRCQLSTAEAVTGVGGNGYGPCSSSLHGTSTGIPALGIVAGHHVEHHGDLEERMTETVTRACWPSRALLLAWVGDQHDEPEDVVAIGQIEGLYSC